ncbi:MAG: 1-deoxy-D-xylulose-5-phosphate synthase N-terminal domain-containing protein [Chloroflexota bacterium]
MTQNPSPTPSANGSNGWQDEARRVAHGIRKRVLALTIDRNGCYLSQALSSAETLAVLYTHVMKLGSSQAPMIPPPFPGVPGPDNIGYVTGAAYNGPQEAELDRLLISPAHYAVAIYAVLVETGRMAQEGLDQFNTNGSTVEMIGAEHSPGFELTTGSFGQAVSQAGGIAMGRRLKRHTGRVFVFMSDGELEEGQTWEAVQALAHHKLDNIVVYVDVNGQQCDGWTKDIMNIEPIQDRLEAFGARVISVDGHDVAALAAASAPANDGKPLFILAYTDPAKGMPMLDARKPKLHYVRPHSSDELEQFKVVLQEMEQQYETRGAARWN